MFALIFYSLAGTISLFRSGTENVAMIAGLGAAAQLVTDNIGSNLEILWCSKQAALSLLKSYLKVIMIGWVWIRFLHDYWIVNEQYRTLMSNVMIASLVLVAA